MNVSIDEVRELLAETRHVLETEGWAQGSFHHEGRHCLVGAMIRAKKRLHGSQRAYCDAMAVLHPRTGFGSLPRWNDAPERTIEDVIQLLKDVEHGLEAGEL